MTPPVWTHLYGPMCSCAECAPDVDVVACEIDGVTLVGRGMSEDDWTDLMVSLGVDLDDL